MSYPLFTEDTLREMLAELRGMLCRMDFASRPEALVGPVAEGIAAHAGKWFQRIDFPEQGIRTASRPDWVIWDEGGVNRLGGRLTSEEGCQLRPWPK